MVVRQGEIWWTNFAEPIGSKLGFERPALVVQGNSFNRSLIDTILCVPLTTNLRLKNAPGNVFLSKSDSGLPKDSVANISQVSPVDRQCLEQIIGYIDEKKLELVLSGIAMALGQ